jgi:hypothetical protein
MQRFKYVALLRLRLGAVLLRRAGEELRIAPTTLLFCFSLFKPASPCLSLLFPLLLFILLPSPLVLLVLNQVQVLHVVESRTSLQLEQCR